MGRCAQPAGRLKARPTLSSKARLLAETLAKERRRLVAGQAEPSCMGTAPSLPEAEKSERYE